MSCHRFALVFFSSMLFWPLTIQADQSGQLGPADGQTAGQSSVAPAASSAPVISNAPAASSASSLPSAPTASQSAPSAPETSSQSMSETVTVQVETILATNSEEPVDARLTDIRHRLKAFRYSSYKLVQEKSQLVSWGKKASFSLPGGRFLQVVPRAYANERIGLQVIFLEGGIPTPLMSTMLNIRNHGKLYISREHQGGMLILRIGAKTESPR